MEFECEPYMGCLVVQGAAFALQLHKLLRDHIGLSIKEIGDLDLSGKLIPSARLDPALSSKDIESREGGRVHAEQIEYCADCASNIDAHCFARNCKGSRFSTKRS